MPQGNTGIVKQTSALLITAMLLLALSPLTAPADDLNPPPFRGGPRSVMVEFQLNPTAPGYSITQQSYIDQNGNSQLSTNLNQPPTITPNSEDLGLDLFIPNWIDNEPFKYLRIQVTFDGDVPGPTEVQATKNNDPLSPASIQFHDRSPITTLLPSGLNYFYEDWWIMPNPDFENILIAFDPTDTLVHQIVIDTISHDIPEPTMAAALGLGLIGLATMRRRRPLA